MTLKFDSLESEPLALTKGIDQGCLLFGDSLLYNAYLVEI